MLLPAPFGPIRQWISPGCKREVDGVGDVQAAEMLVQLAQLEQRHQLALCVRRAASRPSQFISTEHETVRGDQHGEHQQHAHEDQRILAAVDRQSAWNAASTTSVPITVDVRSLRPADRDPDQRQRRRGHAHARRRDVLSPRRVKHARKCPASAAPITKVMSWYLRTS